MQRDYKIYLADMLEAIEKIEEYTKGLQFEEFRGDRLKQDAIVWNLAVIGEAAKSLPDAAKPKDNSIDWTKIAGLRNILVHQYFNVKLETVWDVVINKIPVLKKLVSDSLEK